jgi:dephospho-CoA kinase
MYLVGLTGGIAAGKSTVASLWESLGATIIDADVLARKAVEPGSEDLEAVSDAFPGVVDASGVLDRKALADQVFNDPAKRKKLETIIHPIVRSLALKEIESATTPVVVYVVPLLVEAEVDYPFNLIVTVEAPHAEQVKRMVSSRGLTEAEAKARIGSQTSAAMRANHAHVILNSNQSIDLLRAEARELFEMITERAK